MTTNTSHSNCTHPATKSARAACRKGRLNAGPEVTFANVTMAPALAAAMQRIVKIEWERETCSRCAGTGQYPSPAWQGVCLKCGGKGKMLTRAGRAALAKYDAYLAAHHTKNMIDLEPGDIVRDHDGRRTVVEVDRTIKPMGTTSIGVEGTDSYVTYTNLTITVKYRSTSYIIGPYCKIALVPRGEEAQAAFRHVAHMKGAIVHYAV